VGGCLPRSPSGAGGAGKTRLAIEAATPLPGEFPDGICFVDLAPVTDPQLVITAPAHALELRDAGSRPPAERRERYLRPRKLLLIPDNGGHVAGACARLADSLLQVCTRSKDVSWEPARFVGRRRRQDFD
jgi:predicted ATPase